MGYYSNLIIEAEENPVYQKAQDDLMDSIALNHHLINVLAGIDQLTAQESAEVGNMQASYSHDKLTDEEQEQLNAWIDSADKEGM
jgi:hypothetical protein